MQHASNILATSKYDRSAELDLRERRANSTPPTVITFLELGESICTSPWLFSDLIDRYVFFTTFDECHYFVKKLMTMDASEKQPYVKRFMADPVLFYQALNLVACSSVRLGVQGDAFIRLLKQEHPDIEDIASNSDKKMEHAGDGDSESKADKKVDGGKSDGTIHNNVIKFACCIPKQLRYKLQDALRHFSKDLFSNLKIDEKEKKMQQGEEVNYFDMFDQKYFIFFGSSFWLDIMRARFACFKQKSLSISQYVRSCLKIRIDIDGLCLHVPWQDIVLSVRATVPDDIQPSRQDWSRILRKALGVSVSDDTIADLVKFDVHPYQEMWSVLDAAYDTPSKGFFDFEGGAKQVFWTALQEDLSPQLPVEVFENWWSSLRDISEMRDKSKTQKKNREAAISNLERYLAAANAHEKCSEAFWLHSAKALWLLDMFRDSREIMFEEFELNQEPSSGAKRPQDFESFPRKFSQLFECLSTEFLECSERFRVMVIHPGKKNAKIFRNFGDWLEEEQAIRQREEEDD